MLTVERPPKPDPRSILVQGIPESVSTDLLELFFENKKRSSGGDIDHIQYEAGTGEAVITFKEPEGLIQFCSELFMLKCCIHNMYINTLYHIINIKI